MVERPEMVCQWEFELPVGAFEGEVEGEEWEVGDAVRELVKDVESRVGRLSFERIWKAVWAKSLGLKMERELGLHGRLFWVAGLTKEEIAEIRGIEVDEGEQEEGKERAKREEEGINAKLDNLNISSDWTSTAGEDAGDVEQPRWIRLFEKKEEQIEEKTSKTSRRKKHEKKTATAGSSSRGGGRQVVGSDTWVEAQNEDRKKKSGSADEVVW